METVLELKKSTKIVSELRTDKKKFNILYIGNDKDFKLAILDSGLFDMTYKENGFLAINYLEENDPPDAIISELLLQGMSGFSIRMEVQRRIKLQGIPFFIVDKSFSVEEKGEAWRTKVDDIFFKPVSAEKIYTRLSFLTRYKQMRNIESYLENKRKKVSAPLWKRTFDIFFASIILLCLTPVFLLIIIAQQLESFGPVFYSGKRVGAGYNIFPFHKFRSMYIGADKKIHELAKTNNQYKTEDVLIEEEPVYDCPLCAKSPDGQCSTILQYKEGKKVCEHQYNIWKNKKDIFIKIANDPRVTKVGKFIRKTSIDELPQLFNVLKGEMSIVGNRPIPLYEAEMLTSDNYIERFNAPAGITGLWQVSKRGQANMSEDERKMLDTEYVKNMSLWTDIKILIKTPLALIADEDV
jgi:lipopolysaccharide/colanic/teichoic acid biosynthesis glycosyltransferase